MSFVVTPGDTLTAIPVPLSQGGTSTNNAATARTNLGATTIGANLFTLTNPGAVTFPQLNADNTVSALGATAFRTAIGAGTGNGSVTSVAASAGAGISISGSPITGSGTLGITNTGVTQLTAGTGISISGSTGNVTVSASGGSSYVFLGRVSLGSGVGTASISLPGSWQNTYDAILFTIRGYAFASFGGIPFGSIFLDNVSSGLRYSYAYMGPGGSSTYSFTGSANNFALLATVSNNYGLSCNGFITYSGNYDTTISTFVSSGASQGGFVVGNFNNAFVTGAPTSIQWYNGGYNATTTYYLTGAFTAWGLKNS